MCDALAIETFKWANKPTWYKLTPTLVVAKWIINGQAWMNVVNPLVDKYTHGWAYEPEGE